MRWGRIAAALIVILVGVAFLLGNLGLLALPAWESLLGCWPVLLILLGVFLLLGGGFRWLVVVVLLAVIVFGAVGVRWPGGWDTSVVTETFASDAALPAVNRFVAQLETDVGQISMAQPSEQLYQLKFKHSSSVAPRLSFATLGETGTLLFKYNRPPISYIGRRGNELALSFSPLPELDLEVRIGVGEVDLDLSQLLTSRLKVKCGVGRTWVRLGRIAGTAEVELETGVGEIVLEVPAGIGLRVVAEAGLGSREFDAAGLRKVNGAWENDAYAAASSRVQARLSSSIGSLRVLER